MAGHFLSSPLQSFADWYRSILEEFPDEFSADCLGLLRRVITVGLRALEYPEDSKTIDSLLTDFYLVYIDNSSHATECHLEYANESWASIRWFRVAIQSIEKNLSLRTLRLLEIIFTGRPILRSPDEQPFCSQDGIVRLGYWTASETAEISQSLLGIDFTEEEAALRNIRSAVNTAVKRATGVIILVA